MVAKSNYKHNLSQTTISRHASWSFHTEKTHIAITKIHRVVDTGEEWTFRKPTHYKGPFQFNDASTNRVYQALLFLSESGTCRFGVVEEVFRGSAVRQDPKTNKKQHGNTTLPRALKVSKPVGFELDTRYVAKLKLSQLDCLGGEVWETSCAHQPHLIIPYTERTRVFGEIRVKTVVCESGSLKLVLPEDAATILERHQA